MAVPSTIADLDAVASNNSPAGTESIGTSLDDYLRAHAAIIKQVSNAKLDSSSVTAAGLALIDDADAAAQRTTLGLGTAATQASTAFATAGAITTSGLTQATGKLIGRSTASTGAPEEITVGTGLSLSAGTLSVSSTGLTLGTSQATTSGTSIDFTSIPSTVKRITVMLKGVSSNGTSQFLIQVGAGSITSSGYASTATGLAGTVSTGSSTAGFILFNSGLLAASSAVSSNIVICTIGSNSWIATHNSVVDTSGPYGAVGAGSVTLGGTLDRIRLTTANGTDTFDAGTINIIYE